jgi:hypothetical protein
LRQRVIRAGRVAHVLQTGPIISRNSSNKNTNPIDAD